MEGVRAVNISGYLLVGLPRVVTGLSTNELESNDGFVVVLKSLNPRPAASSHLISSDGRRPTAQLRWWWFLSKVAVVAIWEWLARFSLEPTMVMSVISISGVLRTVMKSKCWSSGRELRSLVCWSLVPGSSS